MTIAQQLADGAPLVLGALSREVAAMEELVALVRRRAELEAELTILGVSWSGLPLKATEIIAFVGAKHQLEVCDIVGPSRAAPCVAARQEAMFLLREQAKPDGRPRFSYPQIGEILGGRDHTTVLHGIARHRERVTA